MLYQLCPSWLSHASGVCGGGGERSSELRLIKFDDTQQIGSWVRGNFSHTVSLYPVSVEDRTSVAFLILSYQLAE